MTTVDPLARSRDHRDGPVSSTAIAARAWLLVAGVLMAGVVAQPFLAGLMVRGHDWAETAHEKTGFGLVTATILASSVAAVTLRRREHGRAVISALVAFAVLIVIQTALGESAADGRDVLWLHFPLGVALVGAAMRLLRATRALADPATRSPERSHRG
jgi:hypothetical protein